MARLDSGSDEALRRRIAELEELVVGTAESLATATESLTTATESLAATRESLATVMAERDRLRRAYAVLREHYELLRRQLFAAKAERIDASQLELEFAETKAKLEAMATLLDGETGDLGPPADADSSVGQPAPAPPPEKPKPKGRRNLRDKEMPETRIELTDPELEGKVERIGFEESCRYGYRRGGPVRIIIARATYKKPSGSGCVCTSVSASAVRSSTTCASLSATCSVSSTSNSDSCGSVDSAVEALAPSAAVPGMEEKDTPTTKLVTVPMPKEMVDRGFLAPSLIAHLLVSKYRFGLPFYRLVEMFRAQNVHVDRGTMCRYAEHIGATLGCIVEACAKEAKETAFCLSTDATGVAIQPEPVPGKRQACRKGHFFVVLADQDHVFFEFQAAQTSDVVCKMFKGFNGYIQADAHAIYNALFRGEARDNPTDKAPEEVGCWAHARRRFWQAATIAKDAPSREALLRIRILSQLEEQWARLPPSTRHAHRQRISRPMLDDFFASAEREFDRVKGVRGLASTAFGYAVRQKEPLRRFLDDGRLPMTNNHSERALRSPICVGRKAWLFCGSDDHASAAANLFSLIASCQLHQLDAETYLAEMIRIVPLWPRDRFLELAPRYWARTRARLDPTELVRELGPLTVPPPLPATEQSPPD